MVGFPEDPPGNPSDDGWPRAPAVSTGILHTTGKRLASVVNYLGIFYPNPFESTMDNGDSFMRYIEERSSSPDSATMLALHAIAWFAGENHICPDDTHEGHMRFARGAIRHYISERPNMEDPETTFQHFFDSRKRFYSGEDADPRARADVADMIICSRDPEHYESLSGIQGVPE